MKDLFEILKLIPPNVQTILDTFNEDEDKYKECSKIEKELNAIGYGYEWGLDGEPYNLHKL